MLLIIALLTFPIFAVFAPKQDGVKNRENKASIECAWAITCDLWSRIFSLPFRGQPLILSVGPAGEKMRDPGKEVEERQYD